MGARRFSFLALELALNLGSSFAGIVLQHNVSFILGEQWWHSGTLRGHKVRLHTLEHRYLCVTRRVSDFHLNILLCHFSAFFFGADYFELNSDNDLGVMCP